MRRGSAKTGQKTARGETFRNESGVASIDRSEGSSKMCQKCRNTRSKFNNNNRTREGTLRTCALGGRDRNELERHFVFPILSPYTSTVYLYIIRFATAHA